MADIMLHIMSQKKLQINLLTCEANAPVHSDFMQKTPLLDSARGVLLTGLMLLLCILGGTAVFSYYASQDENSGISHAWSSVSSLTKFANFNHFTGGFGKQLNGEDERINILALGIGGAGHEGPQLADSLMLISIDPKQKQIALFSIPRDLVVSMEEYGIRKINNANAFGEEQQVGWGGEFTRRILEKTFDVPIQYYIRIDFAGFAKIIDAVGGVTVTVDHTFTDYRYPTLNKKYQTVSFQAGEQQMDGSTALMFARSRHSPMNNEGSDFARGKRQQKVLLALKNKITSREILLNPSKLSELLTLAKDNIITNVASWEVARFLSLMKDFDLSSIISVSFDDSPQGLLASSISPEGAYILEPQDGTFQKIREKVKTIFANLDRANLNTLNAEHPVVSIKNGTAVEGLAMQTAKYLQTQGFIADFIGNASTRNASQTTIYDFTEGKKPESLRYLQGRFPKSTVSVTPTEERTNIPGSDFLIILGLDAQ